MPNVIIEFHIVRRRGGKGEREGVGWGSKGGGWRGGAGDQVIRIINLGSSCWGVGVLGKFPETEKEPGREEAVESGWGRAPT